MHKSGLNYNYTFSKAWTLCIEYIANSINHCPPKMFTSLNNNAFTCLSKKIYQTIPTHRLTTHNQIRKNRKPDIF